MQDAYSAQNPLVRDVDLPDTLAPPPDATLIGVSTAIDPTPHALTITTTRVYGSHGRYGAHPRESPPGGPLRLRDFPGAGYQADAVLGSPVEWLFRADRLSRAIGAAALEGVVAPTGARGSVGDRVSQLEHELLLAGTAEVYEWYVTLAISHEVAVAPELLKARNYVWLDPGEAMRIERDERRVAPAALDAVAASLASVLREECFESIVLPDQTYFTLPGRETIRLPQFSVGTVRVSMQGGTIDVEAVARALEASRALAHGLSSVASWRMAAMGERDPWKRFDWTFLALEILVHRMASRLYGTVVASLRSQVGERVHVVPGQSLLQPLERLALSARFAVVALALRPEFAEADIDRFRVVKKARDEMSHGAIRDPADLPIQSAAELLAQYLSAALSHGGGS